MHLTISRWLGSIVAVACLLASAAASFAQEVGDAMFVTVQNPITGDTVARIKQQIDPRTNEANKQRRVDTIVFDFNPDGKPAGTSDFGPCYDLAKYIGSGALQGRRTVAFVHAPVTGHTVLPVLACVERVVGKAGVIGPVVSDGVPSVPQVEQNSYRERVASRDRWPIIQKMFDPGVRLVSGTLRDGADKVTVYADARDEDALKRIAGFAPVQGVQDGIVAGYAAPQARALGLAQARADTRPEVAEVFGLPASSVRDDPLQGRSPDAYLWVLKGDVDGAMRESLNRVIRDVRKKKGNVLVLELNCGGTDLDTAHGLAEDLIKAQSGEDAVQVIAFVPESAPDAATVVALGCSEIVMTKPAEGAEGKEADIGNFERFLKSAKPAAIEAQRQSLRKLAEDQGYPGVLIDGMLARDLEIVRATANGNAKKTKLMTRAEFDTELKANPGVWAETPKVIKPKGVPFHPSATLAAELGLARFIVPTTNPNDVCKIYGASAAKSPDPGWLDKFAEFLKIPAVTIILVMVGFIGLILELKVPGLTVPGITAALCFILVFWSQSRFSGEMFVLALLLFLLGLALIGIEIFVLPGFGACGICGILCMLAGLGLVTLDKVPSDTGEWVRFGVRISTYLFAMMGALVLAFVIAKFLPQVPYANRMMLAPPTDTPSAGETDLPGASAALELLGAIGTTTTALRPAGVVRFGDKFVDVVSDGGFIPSGTRVQVITVEGTRIVVKEV